jgi:hypothetical protein
LVLSALFHRYPQFRPGRHDHTAVFLFQGGLAYVVGYALQYGFSTFSIVRTHLQRRLPWIARILYQRFTGELWIDLDDIDFPKIEALVAEVSQYQRIVTLKHIGTTVGPCAAVAALLFYPTRYCPSPWLIPALLAALAVLLILSGWVKCAEQLKFLERTAKAGV